MSPEPYYGTYPEPRAPATTPVNRTTIFPNAYEMTNKEGYAMDTTIPQPYSPITQSEFPNSFASLQAPPGYEPPLPAYGLPGAGYEDSNRGVFGPPGMNGVPAMPMPIEHYDLEMANKQGTMCLAWENISYTVFKGTPKERTILQGATGCALPGRVLAIMGPSGAGKTTMLTCLADRVTQNKHSVLTGQVYVNSLPYKPEFRKAIGFVMQDDIVFETATPREAFEFNAGVRAPRAGQTAAQRKARVEEVINKLKLQKCADTVIGTPGLLRGVSGGERKRVNIGTELIANPRILILDEPTSGLDTANAGMVVQLMRDLARNEGVTVICTIHQPSSKVFSYFDDVLLLSKGQVAYHGPVSEAVSYFASIGHPCPAHYNPADFYMTVLHEDITTGPQWQNAMALRGPHYPQLGTPSHPNGQFAFPTKDETVHSLEWFISNTTSKWPGQFAACSRRSWKNFMRHKMLLKARIGQTIIFAVLMGALFFGIDNNQSGVMDRVGLLFVIVINVGFSAMMGGVMSFPEERAVFMREQAGGLYSPTAYTMAKTLMEVPSHIIFPIMFAVIVYWMADLTNQAGAFILFCVILILLANSSASLGFAVGSVAANAEMALALTPAVMMPFMLVAGLTANTDRLSPHLLWLKWISVFRYAYISLMHNEFEHVKTIECDATVCPYKTGDQVIDVFDFEAEPLWLMMTLLGIFVVVLRVLGSWALIWKSRRQFK